VQVSAARQDENYSDCNFARFIEKLRQEGEVLAACEAMYTCSFVESTALALRLDALEKTQIASELRFQQQQ
jgi:hypothetical protein